MIPRKEFVILRQPELRIWGSPDDERVVPVEFILLSGVRPVDNEQCDFHSVSPEVCLLFITVSSRIVHVASAILKRVHETVDSLPGREIPDTPHWYD